MPNYCENELSVSGPAADVQQFREQAAGDEEALNIRHFIPMPEEINSDNTTSPNRDQEQAQRLTEKHGAPDWYEWAMQHWGTHRDAHEVKLQHSYDDGQEAELRYTYITAWTPFSQTALADISAQFPTLKLTVSYEEAGLCFAGYMAAEQGELTGAREWDTFP